MLHLPEMVESGAVGALYAIQSLFPRAMFRVRFPWFGKLKKFQIAKFQPDTPEVNLRAVAFCPGGAAQSYSTGANSPLSLAHTAAAGHIRGSTGGGHGNQNDGEGFPAFPILATKVTNPLARDAFFDLGCGPNEIAGR